MKNQDEKDVEMLVKALDSLYSRYQGTPLGDSIHAQREGFLNDLRTRLNEMKE